MSWFARGCVLLALLVAAAIVLAMLPARWVLAPLASATRGVLAVEEVRGTLWRGSGAVRIARSATEHILLPERLSWRVEPAALLLGRIDARLRFGQRPDSQLTGNLKNWRLTDGMTEMPAYLLGNIGAPLNTLAPGGWVELRWNGVSGSSDSLIATSATTLQGTIETVWLDATTRLSGSPVLGDYAGTAQLEGAQVRLSLLTRSGVLRVKGDGKIALARGSGSEFTLVSSAPEAERERL
ncbi:MAG: type secretion system family protein, partial [Pseudomonadota bacterium]